MDRVLSAAIVLGLLYIGGQYVASLPAYEEQAVEAGRQITVSGEADFSARPDVAKITVGSTSAPLPTAEAALEFVSNAFSKVVAELEQIGIEEDDIKTSNFNLSPQYDYTDGRQQLRGYVASEQITVTVRDLSKVGEVITRTTQAGANQIGDIVFDVKEDSDLKVDAEKAAIDDARDKAERLAKSLGASLGPVLSYSTSGGEPVPVPLRFSEADVAAQKAPVLPPGVNEGTVSVTITFGLR